MTSSFSTIAADRRLWALQFTENAFYGGFFILYIISSLLLFQRRHYLQKQVKQGFGGQQLDNVDKERLLTMQFWEITGAVMFAILTVVSYLLYTYSK